jgi:hypothetical protein
MTDHSEEKTCDSINIVQMILICMILFFFFDLLIIEKTTKKSIIKILTGTEN